MLLSHGVRLPHARSAIIFCRSGDLQWSVVCALDLHHRRNHRVVDVCTRTQLLRSVMAPPLNRAQSAQTTQQTLREDAGMQTRMSAHL